MKICMHQKKEIIQDEQVNPIHHVQWQTQSQMQVQLCHVMMWFWIWIWMTTSKYPDHWCYTTWGVCTNYWVIEICANYSDIDTFLITETGRTSPLPFQESQAFNIVNQISVITHSSPEGNRTGWLGVKHQPLKIETSSDSSHSKFQSLQH